ncbi:MAG: enoyl-CoA hydratase-related protein [Sphingobium sp.]
MAHTPLIRFEDDDGVRTLVLDRGDGQNAVGPDMQAALAPALDAAAADPAVHVLILTGAGKMFSAGGDLGGLLTNLPTRDPVVERQGLSVALEVVQRILTFPKPTIAMINGAAAGGGLALALACDMRIMSAKAKLAYAYAMIGLAGDFGINWLLARLVGPARARTVAFGGPLDAQEAWRLGIVDTVVAPEDLEAATRERARGLATLSGAALAAIKRNIDAADLSFAEAGERESESFIALRSGGEHRLALETMLAQISARKGR